MPQLPFKAKYFQFSFVHEATQRNFSQRFVSVQALSMLYFRVAFQTELQTLFELGSK